MKDNVKPIKYHKGIFDVFKNNPNLYNWDGLNGNNFSEVMWGLGYDMNCRKSFEEYAKNSPLKVNQHTSERERKKNVLYYLEYAQKQIIGNYRYSKCFFISSQK